MKISILYEDKNLMVLNKPAGLAVHADAKNPDDETVASFISSYDKSIDKVGEQMTVEYEGKTVKIARPGIVHRLDKETSGVLIVAKNQKTFSELKEQFRGHTLTKTYIALVEGKVTPSSFTINAPLGRNKKDYKQQVNPVNPRGE